MIRRKPEVHSEVAWSCSGHNNRSNMFKMLCSSLVHHAGLTTIFLGYVRTHSVIRLVSAYISDMVDEKMQENQWYGDLLVQVAVTSY